MSRRVLFVAKGLDLGGLERVVADLAIGLTRRGWPVALGLVNPGRDQLVSSLEREGVPVHPLGGSDKIGFGAGVRLQRLIRNGGFEIVHVHGPMVSAMTRCVARRVPIVSTSHTPWSSLHWLSRAAWRATWRRDAAVVAVSEAVMMSLPRHTQDRVTVIPHGLDPDRLAAAKAHRAAHPQSGDSCSIIVVASHRDAKNYPNLLRAVRIAVDRGAPVRLTAIGAGKNLPAHRALTSDLGLDEVVQFLPPDLDVLDRIAASDLLVVASDYEGQPIVVAEALAVGTPIVATAVGRVPEMVTPSVGRVVLPHDASALGMAIAELAGEPELRAAMSRTALASELHRTTDDVVNAHLELYEQI